MELPPEVLRLHICCSPLFRPAPLPSAGHSVDCVALPHSFHAREHSLSHLSPSLQSSQIFSLQRNREKRHLGFCPDDHPAPLGCWDLFIPMGDQPCPATRRAGLSPGQSAKEGFLSPVSRSHLLDELFQQLWKQEWTRLPGLREPQGSCFEQSTPFSAAACLPACLLVCLIAGLIGSAVLKQHTLSSTLLRIKQCKANFKVNHTI